MGKRLMRGAVFAAVFACFWSSSLLVRQSVEPVPFFAHYTSRIVEIIACFLVATVALRHPVPTKSLLGVAAGSFAIYCAAEAARLGMSTNSGWLLFAAGCANGIFVACAVLLLARTLCRFEPRDALVVVPTSMALAHGIFLLTGFLPREGLVVVKMVLLGVSLVACMGYERAVGPDETFPARRPVDLKALVGGPLSLSLWFGMVIFPLFYGFMAQICTAAKISSGLFDYPTEIAATVMLVLLAVAGVVRKGYLDAEGIFVAMLPVFATALLVLPMFWGHEVFVAGFIMKCGFSVYTALMWIALQRMVRQEGWSCFFLFGLSLGLYHLALMVGRLVASALTDARILSLETIAGAALVAVWLLSMCALFILWRTRRGVRENGSEGDAPPTYEQVFAAFADAHGLSGREREVCREYARGCTVESVAARLAVSQETVKTHIKRAYAKTDCHSRQDLIDKIEHGSWA